MHACVNVCMRAYIYMSLYMYGCVHDCWHTYTYVHAHSPSIM